jgi:hypothetical protein
MNTNCFNQDNPQLDPLVLGVLAYDNKTATPDTQPWIDDGDTMDVICRDLNLTDLAPLNPSPVLDPDLFMRVDISFQTGAGDLNFGYMNSTTWVSLNGSDILSQTAYATSGNYTALGVDTTDFNNHQFVFSLPNVLTVEYFSFVWEC